MHVESKKSHVNIDFNGGDKIRTVKKKYKRFQYRA